MRNLGRRYGWINKAWKGAKRCTSFGADLNDCTDGALREWSNSMKREAEDYLDDMVGDYVDAYARARSPRPLPSRYPPPPGGVRGRT